MAKNIGFIGIGVMGSSMAYNLIRAGYNVNVYTRTKDKANLICSHGASWSNSVLEVAMTSDVIISMVGYPQDVEEIYLAENGIINNSKKGSIIIDMTTSKPSLARKIFAKAKEKGLKSLDAPVTGGDIGAKNATLTIMVGGEKSVFDLAMPIFKSIGKNIFYSGIAGSGMNTKLANQIAIAGAMIGWVEALAFANSVGLDVDNTLSAISSGSASSWQMQNIAPRALLGDYSPGFYVKHFLKDLKLALEEVQESGTLFPGLEVVKNNYEKLVELGFENDGTQALYKLYKK